MRRAHRTSHVIDGRLRVVNATVPLSTETTSAQSSPDNAHVDNGYFPLMSVRTPPYQHDPTLAILEGLSHGTSANENTLLQLNKELPSAPVLPEIESPDLESWGPLIDSIKDQSWHDEYIFDLNAPDFLRQQDRGNTRRMSLGYHEQQLQPAEDEANQTSVYEPPVDVPYSTLHHPKPTNLALLARGTCILQHGTEAQPAISDVWQAAEHVQERPDPAVVSQQDSAMPREIAAGTTLSPVIEEQDQEAPPVYAQFTKMRTWDYEEVEGAYNEAMHGPATPPPSPPARHSGVFHWFYGNGK